MISFFKKYKLFALAFLTCWLGAGDLQAMSFGREGESYEEAGVLWQPVKIEMPEGTCRTALPGKPAGMMSGGFVRVVSQDVTGIYVLRTSFEYDPKYPKTAKKLLEKLDAEIMNEPEVEEYQSSVLKQLPPGAVYGVEYSFVYQGQKQLSRAYCNAKGRLFTLSVLTTDQTLYSVFDKVKLK